MDQPAPTAIATTGSLPLVERLVAARLPVSGSIELTYACSFDCPHCYIGTLRQNPRSPRAAEWWFDLLDQVAGSGCLALLITGGDPLLHAGFEQIWRHAVGLGLRTTLFTNGMLLDERHIALFREWPPVRIEVTLYGRDEAGYRTFTGAAGSWERVRRAIDLVTAAGLPLTLKVILAEGTTVGLCEFGRSWAERIGAKFRYEGEICGSLDGCGASGRIAAEHVVAVEQYDQERLAHWRRKINGRRPLPSGRLYNCGAGTNTFHVTPDGLLTPCLMEREFAVSLDGRPFLATWRELGDRVSAETRTAGCAGCLDWELCGYCPPIGRLEGVPAEGPSPFHCELARARRALIKAGDR